MISLGTLCTQACSVTDAPSATTSNLTCACASCRLVNFPKSCMPQRPHGHYNPLLQFKIQICNVLQQAGIRTRRLDDVSGLSRLFRDSPKCTEHQPCILCSTQATRQAGADVAPFPHQYDGETSLDIATGTLSQRTQYGEENRFLACVARGELLMSEYGVGRVHFTPTLVMILLVPL